MKALIVYYSMYGHVHQMAEAVAAGVREVPGAEVTLRRVPETLPAGGPSENGGDRGAEGVRPRPRLLG